MAEISVQQNSCFCPKLLCLLFVRKIGRNSAEPKDQSTTTYLLSHWAAVASRGLSRPI